jgi:uroporphyrinogen-III synthase
VGLLDEALGKPYEVFSVGRTSEQVLAQHGLAVTHRSDAGAEELNRFITHNPVLVLGAQEMREELTHALRQRGLEVEHIKCYRTKPVSLNADQQAILASADVVVIGAPSTWSVAKHHVSTSAWIVVPGATTAAVVSETHPQVVVGWDARLPEAVAAFEEQTPAKRFHD